MYRLIRSHLTRPLLAALLLLSAMASACAPVKPVVRDQLEVEKLRLRITKVRNAIAETRGVIASSRGAPYLPEIYMRLAELLSEEARYHYMVAYEREQRGTKSLHVPQVRFLKERAIATYQMILTRYPGTRLSDRILFNMSHEQREVGDFDEMKKTLEKLIKEYPESPYRTEASLVLGDFHFDKLEFARAREYYTGIVQHEKDPLLGLAYYKLGWVFVNVGDCKQALNSFEKAILVQREADEEQGDETEGLDDGKPIVVDKQEFGIPDDVSLGREFAGHNSVNVEREALVDLTYCYSQERKPEEAVTYLRKLASTREAYVAALGKMASRYALIEQPRGAADVTRELLRLAPDDEERLDDARMLHAVVVRLKDYTDVGDDVYLVLRAMRRQLLKPKLEESAAALLEKEFEMLARDMATKSHEQLMDAIREAGDGRTVDWVKMMVSPEATAEAYETYLDVLPDSAHRLEIVQNLAEVLMESQRYLEAGHRYREAARLLDAGLDKAADGKGDTSAQREALRTERAGTLYNAVVAYQRSLETERARGHLERATARAGLRQAGGLFLLAKGTPEPEKARKIKFAIGQSYYDEGSYLEAIDLLTAVAYEYPGTEQGNAAVHMVLDSYNTINDLSGLISIGRRFLTPESPVSDEIKAQVKPILATAEQNRLDELSLAASGEHAGGMERLLAFADRYKDSDLGERAMISAFVAARASGDVTRLYDLGEEVIKRFPASNQIPGVVSTMGRTAAVRFEFERAIGYLERAAALSTDQRAALLLAAGEIRAQLADSQGALADYRKALEAAGEGALHGEAAAHLADLIERGGKPQEIIDSLTPLADPPQPEISSRLGLALLRVGRNDEAEAQLRQVIEGAAASPAAQARANYGMAEIMLHTLEQYDPPPALDAIEEAVGLVDVVLQSYLAAARLSDPVYSQAALARLARAAQVGAQKLEGMRLPDDISAEERSLVEEAMKRRAEELRASSAEALAECARRAGASYLLDEAGRACIAGVPPTQDPVQLHALKPRGKAADRIIDVKGARERLSRNPDDLEALTEVGTAYLNAGDAHGARLVLVRSLEVGGGAAEMNLLGVASYRAGDVIGALDAFGRGRDAGSHAAALNLAAVCSELGLAALAKEVLAKAPSGAPPSGLLLDGARSLRGGGK